MKAARAWLIGAAIALVAVAIGVFAYTRANKKVEPKYDRAKTLAERQLIATADRDTAESTAAAAKAQVAASQGSVEQASASLHQAQVNKEYSTIKSPIDGVVISRNVDVGQTVAASL